MSKHAFWQALVFTVIVFSLGLLLGYFIEVKQSQSAYSDIMSSELNILDEQLRQQIISDLNVSCVNAKESLFSFADKIYEDAIDLDDSDTTGRLSDLTALHRRYDLLRTMLLIEAMSIKERCNEDFHIINYLYLYNAEDIEINSIQNYFSRQIFDLKMNHPQDLIIIPIAVDTNIESINLLVKSSGLKKFPVIVVDKNKIVSEFKTLDELEALVFDNTNSP